MTRHIFNKQAKLAIKKILKSTRKESNKIQGNPYNVNNLLFRRNSVQARGIGKIFLKG